MNITACISSLYQASLGSDDSVAVRCAAAGYDVGDDAAVRVGLMGCLPLANSLAAAATPGL
jgi:hypothetical protein